MGYPGQSTYGNSLAKGEPRKPQRKFVFGSHSNTCHVWAQQNDATRDGRASDGRIKFEGATIYSYGKHFAMAHFTDLQFAGKRIVLVNGASYSVSTRQHLGYVRGALTGLPVIRVTVPDLTKWLDPSLKWSKGARAKLRHEFHVAALEDLADSIASDYRVTEALTTYDATRVALGIREKRPVDVVAWRDDRDHKRRSIAAAEKLRAAKELIAAHAVPGFNMQSSFTMRESYDPATDEAKALGPWSTQERLRAIGERLRKLGGARLTVAKSKKYPGLVSKASAALKAGKELQAAWVALNNAAVLREQRASDLASLDEVDAFLSHAQTNIAELSNPTLGRPAGLNCGSETVARYAALAIATDRAALGARLQAMVQVAMYRKEVPATFKVETYGRETVTPEDWQAGKGPAYRSWNDFRQVDRTLLRKRGDILETSRGATCPFEHAVKAFKVAQHCRATGQEFKPNGHTIKVGHFAVDLIDAEGNLKAGCHKLDWQEMERLAIREVPAVVKPRYPLPVPCTLPTDNWLIDFDPSQGEYVA